MRLTDTKIRSLRAKNKQYKVNDGNSLFIVITPTNHKYWRYRYVLNKKEKLMALGVYPYITLSTARTKAMEAKVLLAQGIDPMEQRKVTKQEITHKQYISTVNTFENLAREWHTKTLNKWSKRHAARIIYSLEKYIFPWVGNRLISEIKPMELLILIRNIEHKGIIETAHRVLQRCGKVFKYAIITARAKVDPSAVLKGALEPVQTRHHASITDPIEIGKLLRAIDVYGGNHITKVMLKLAPLLFVRPGELRQMEWCEINFDTAEWRIPTTKMKMKSPHIVPLSKQSIHLLLQLKTLTGNSRYVFPNFHNSNKVLSQNTINHALRRLGYASSTMTAHGFRSMACTLLNEQGWNKDAIERQLAHSERNNVRAAYNYAQYLPERRQMMQEWADYLGSLSRQVMLAT
jgi:integrase